jgi:hypothetical protein
MSNVHNAEQSMHAQSWRSAPVAMEMRTERMNERAESALVDGLADARRDKVVRAERGHGAADAPREDEHERCGHELLDALDPRVLGVCTSGQGLLV